MTAWKIEGGHRLAGYTLVPPDKSISHRALFLAALGEGKARIRPLSAGADNRTTLAVLRALGVSIEVSADESEAIVEGVGGPSGLKAPAGLVDCGNSGTTMRLLTGIAAAMEGQVLHLSGDESLNSRPMSRLLPLTKMGAELNGVHRDDKIFPPLHITGKKLVGCSHSLAVASAQVKSAILLAGLWADGETHVLEPGRSRDHTERMLSALGAEIAYAENGRITIQPLKNAWRCPQFDVAPDMSSAAFLLGAALVTKSPDLEIETAVNPTRSGILDVLEAFGVELHRETLPDCGGEPMAKLRLETKRGLRGAVIDGDLTLRAIDEIPLIAGLAAFIPGPTVIKDAGELRVKESDRISTTVALLRAFGAQVEEREDGMIIHGDPEELHAANVDAGHDHRIGLTAAVMGLGVNGLSQIDSAEIVDVSYPGFVETIVSLGGVISLG